MRNNMDTRQNWLELLNPKRRSFLKTVGAREMQGFLFGRPMGFNDFSSLLSSEGAVAH